MTQKFTKSIFLLAFFGLSISGFAQFGGGDGTSGNPYQITTPAHLAQLATFVNSGEMIYNAAHYKLTNDLNLAEYGEMYNGGKGWISIGTMFSGNPDKPFRGVFNGNGKVITGLYIDNNNNPSSGLFGVTVDATIENLGLENVSINGSWYIGGVVGYAESSIISHCYSTGTINGLNSYCEIGGIAGKNTIGGSITHCYSITNVSGNCNNIGGIVGQVTLSGVISHCYSTGIISGKNYVGGIAGNVTNEAATYNCVALNPYIMATGAPFGRIAGGQGEYDNLTNNYAFDGMLNPSGTADWDNIGGAALDGADLSVSAIHADGTLKGLFTSANGWTTQNGKLPGLFGNTVAVPPHLSSTPVTPVITTTSLSNGTIGETYSEHLFATGTYPITWSVASGALPAGLSLSTGGIISGVPTATGTFTFTVKAENSAGAATKSLSIAIGESDAPPVITTSSIPDGGIDVLYEYTLSATGAPPITWSMVGGTSIAGIYLSADGVLYGTPTTIGTFPFTVKATNSAGSDTKTLKITIVEKLGIVETDNYPSLRVFPNPTMGELRVTSYGLQETRLIASLQDIAIFDVMGRMVYTVKTRFIASPHDDTATLDISHLPTGIYFLKIDNQTVKIIKQ